MDWATNDPMRTYADTIYVPEPESGTGIYLLDESDRRDDPYDRNRLQAPIRPYEGDQRGRYGVALRRDAEGRERFDGRRVAWERPGSSGASPRAYYDNVDWDPRPMRYNPNAGTDWAGLVPPPQLRPPGSGPSRYAAFPPMTQSEADNRPWNMNLPSEAFTSGRSMTGLSTRQLEFVLLAILLYLVASLAGRCLQRPALNVNIVHQPVAVVKAPPPGEK